MKLEQLVLFVDMLGYREINGSIVNDDVAKDFIDFMNFNVEVFSNQNSSEIKKVYESGGFNLYDYYDIQTTFVSDSLIINYKPKDIPIVIAEKLRMLHSANAVFILMNRLQTFIYHCLREKNILIRGGISNKYCNIDKNFAVGEGLIEAYLLESKIAIYPRIVFCNDLIEKQYFVDSFNFIANRIYNQDTFLKNDGDDVFYLDYLKFNISLVYSPVMVTTNSVRAVTDILIVYKKSIEGKLNDIHQRISDEKDEKKLADLKKVEIKIEWLKCYYNSCVEVLLPIFLIK